MPRPEASATFYKRLQRLQLVVIMAGRRAWSRMTPDFDQSWAAVSPALVAVTSAGQLAAARAAAEYVPNVLDELGVPVAAEAVVRPQAFAGVAADGRSLLGLLDGAVVRAKQAAPVMPPTQALELGGKRLDGLLQGVVTDAGRGAMQAEIAVRPDVMYVRMVNPPCCINCALLAGKTYKWNAGFSRHPPTCDCTGIPIAENIAGNYLTDPKALFDKGLIRGLSKSQADRIAAGEDIYKVGNESRNMWRARLTEQKIAAEKAEGTAAERDARARMGLEDLFAATRSRIEALDAMRAAGYTT